MKKFLIFTVVFLLVGICFVSAQDLIILKDGSIIEAKVVEISPTEIRYKRFDHLDGPTIVMATDKILSVRYEDGRVETVNAAPLANEAVGANTDRRSVQDGNSESSAMNPNETTFALAAAPTGFFLFGPSITAEFTKGKLNTIIDLHFPTIWLLATGYFGFDIGLGLNYFKPSRIGGFYLGGMVGYSVAEYAGWWYNAFDVTLSIGYKFILSSGAYFRTGAYIGVSLGQYAGFLFRPDLSVGYNFGK